MPQGSAPQGIAQARGFGLAGASGANNSMADRASQALFVRRPAAMPSDSSGAGGSDGAAADAAGSGAGELAAFTPGLDHNGPAPFRAPPVPIAGDDLAAASGNVPMRQPPPSAAFGIESYPGESSIGLHVVETLLSLTPAAQARNVNWLDSVCGLLVRDVPHWASIPADCTMARYEFMQETLVEILRGLSGVQVVASADVFSACRSLKC